MVPMANAEVLRAATFNIKHGALADGYLGRPKLLHDACAQLNVDILALQEVDRFVWRSGFRDLAKLAAKATGMQAYFEKTMHDQGGQYGNALLVQGELYDIDIIRLQPDNKSTVIFGRRLNYAREPRNALIGIAKINDTEISVAATHFAGTKEQRQGQFSATLGALACYPPPRLLLGDLNTRYEELQAWDMPASMKFAVNDSTLTNPSPVPTRQIDHIAVDGLQIVTAYTKLPPVSDHLALIAELSMSPA